jgi:hypothetical protein
MPRTASMKFARLLRKKNKGDDRKATSSRRMGKTNVDSSSPSCAPHRDEIDEIDDDDNDDDDDTLDSSSSDESGYESRIERTTASVSGGNGIRERTLRCGERDAESWGSMASRQNDLPTNNTRGSSRDVLSSDERILPDKKDDMLDDLVDIPHVELCPGGIDCGGGTFCSIIRDYLFCMDLTVLPACVDEKMEHLSVKCNWREDAATGAVEDTARPVNRNARQYQVQGGQRPVPTQMYRPHQPGAVATKSVLFSGGIIRGYVDNPNWRDTVATDAPHVREMSGPTVASSQHQGVAPYPSGDHSPRVGTAVNRNARQYQVQGGQRPVPVQMYHPHHPGVVATKSDSCSGGLIGGYGYNPNWRDTVLDIDNGGEENERADRRIVPASRSSPIPKRGSFSSSGQRLTHDFDKYCPYSSYNHGSMTQNAYHAQNTPMFGGEYQYHHSVVPVSPYQ